MNSIARALNNIALSITNLGKTIATNKEQTVNLPVSNTVTSNPGNPTVKITSIYEGKNYYEKGSQTSKVAHIPYEERVALDAIYDALTNKGKHPDHHDHVMRELSTKWPVLHRALKQLLLARKETYNRKSSDLWNPKK